MSLRTDFFAAVESGDLPRVKALLTEDPGLVHARDEEGATALHLAALNARRDLIDLLCEGGADLNARDLQFHATPAGWALHHLREKGAFLGIEIDDIVHAVKTRNVEWTLRLVRRLPRIVTAKDADGRPVAEYARASGVPEIAELFEAALR